MSREPPVLSPVDYDAWKRGYMPPSEHILIDELHFRGAKVYCHSSVGPVEFWVVWKPKEGEPLTEASRNAWRQHVRALIALDLDTDPPSSVSETAPLAVTTTPE